MKQNIAVISLCLFSIISSSQVVDMGGEIGFNSAQMEYNGNTSEKTVHLAAFLTAEYKFTDKFSILGKLGYIGKGGENLNERNSNFDGNFNYLSLYLLPRLYFLNKNKVQPYFFMGPALSYLLSADVNGFDIKDDTNNIDFALQGGIGLKTDLSNSMILDLNVGFEQGFNRVISVAPDQLHNRSFPYIGLGIRYVLN